MNKTITNEKISLTVSSKGAEMTELSFNGTPLLWNADPDLWPRHAPCLFPFVGLCRNKEYRLDGKTYPMTQHGFARDMEFELVTDEADHLVYRLRETEETLGVYPFRFELFLDYKLTENGVKVTHTVVNTGDGTMYFSIGAHPGFYIPQAGKGDWQKCALELRKNGKSVEEADLRFVKEAGLMSDGFEKEYFPGGMVTPSAKRFIRDALVFEDRQVDQVVFHGEDGREFLEVSFDAPLLGIWAPWDKEANFVCIEPWCGRADRFDFDGELSEREHGNKLDAGGKFSFSFEVKAVL